MSRKTDHRNDRCWVKPMRLFRYRRRMVIALTRCPVTLDRTGGKEGKGGKKKKKKHEGNERKGDLSDLSRWNGDGRKTEQGTWPTPFSYRDWRTTLYEWRELCMLLFKRSRHDFGNYDKLSLKIDCLDYCTIEPFAIRPHYLLGPLFVSGDFPS